MYGKRRITLTNDGEIVLAGDKSWIPIGRYQLKEGKISGEFLKINQMWVRKITPDNSIGFTLKNKAELKKIVSDIYTEQLNGQSK